jgi:hypothetical protein
MPRNANIRAPGKASSIGIRIMPRNANIRAPGKASSIGNSFDQLISYSTLQKQIGSVLANN